MKPADSDRPGTLPDAAAGGAGQSSPQDSKGPDKVPLASSAGVDGQGGAARGKRPRDANSSAFIHAKRHRSDLVDANVGGEPGQGPGLMLPMVPVLPAPCSDRHTLYLANLLRYRPLRLILQAPETKQAAPPAKTYARYVTDAGLVINEVVRKQSNVPILRFPPLVGTEVSAMTGDGALDRVAHGVLLEEVWSELGPSGKYTIARRLRKLVAQMRKTPQLPHQGGGRLLGSVFSSKYSLILDKHRCSTYWAVCEKPTQSEFISFLVSTFHPTVPGAVAAAMAAQFRRSGAPVLAHGALGPANIIVNGGDIVAIIGWDCAGWYPEWWDYVKFFEARTGPENSDWYDYAGEIFEDEFPTELALYQGIVRCQSV